MNFELDETGRIVPFHKQFWKKKKKKNDIKIFMKYF